jgi:hypothetical protein
VARGAGTARVLLAGVRIVNGTAALVAPAAMGRRLGVDPDENPAAIYVMRLFGARTVLIGANLLSRNPTVRRNALENAYLIHLSDTLAAVLALSGGNLAPKAARTATVISGGNVALALLARREIAAGR